MEIAKRFYILQAFQDISCTLAVNKAWEILAFRSSCSVLTELTWINNFLISSLDGDCSRPLSQNDIASVNRFNDSAAFAAL